MVHRIPNSDPERLARIHNPQWLFNGIDVAALQQQVDLRKLERKTIEEQQRREGTVRDAQAAVAEAEYQKEQAARAIARRALQNERLAMQGLSKARDWDLSRPDRHRIDCPARITDDDPRCGPSSIQKFAGEDIFAATNRKKQQAGNAGTWQMQVEEKLARMALAKAAEQVAQLQVRELDSIQLAMKLEEARQCATSVRRIQEYNQELAEIRRKAEKEEICLEKEADAHEIELAVNGAFLNEKPISNAEFIAREGQQKQIKENMDMRERRTAEKKKEKVSQDRLLREARRKMLEAALKQGKHDQEYELFLKTQAVAKEASDFERNRLFANAVQPAYFAQFETSHR